jgi:hypothetical protein
MTNVVHYRIKGRTLVGNSYKPNTIEYNNLRKYTSNRSLAIGGIVTLLSIANLVFEIYKLLHLENQEYTRFALIFTPLFVLLITVAVIIKIYKQFGNGKYEKSKGKRGKNKDTWL